MDGMSKFAAKAAGIADTHAVTISDEGARFVGKRPLSPKNNTISITELLDRMKKRASMDSNDDSQALLMATLMLGHKMTFTTWSDLAQLVHAGQHYIASESFCDIDGELHDDIPIQGPRAMESCCESYAFEKNKLVAEHEKSVEQFAFNLKSDLLKVLPAEETISPQPMPAPQSTLRPPHTFSHCLTIDSPVENTGSGPYASRSACEYTNACGAVAISGEQQTNIADPAERRRIKNPIAQVSRPVPRSRLVLTQRSTATAKSSSDGRKTINGKQLLLQRHQSSRRQTWSPLCPNHSIQSATRANVATTPRRTSTTTPLQFLETSMLVTITTSTAICIQLIRTMNTGRVTTTTTYVMTTYSGPSDTSRSQIGLPPPHTTAGRTS